MRRPDRLTYALTFAGLLVLSTTTLVLSLVPLGAFATPLAIAIAAGKTLLIALFFMHLVEQRAANALLLGASLLLVVVFVGLSAADVATRQAGRFGTPGVAEDARAP